ncbi:MAG: hypothetical protein KJ592_03345, partial [Nanoarchaeota archaeon]|nr:hypothetical protein [Nanoarchaeota archaeon]
MVKENKTTKKTDVKVECKDRLCPERVRFAVSGECGKILGNFSLSSASPVRKGYGPTWQHDEGV